MSAITQQLSIAETILKIARDHDIPLRSDPALAEALATLNVGERIPAELLEAVAEVIAFVSRVNER